HGDGGELPYVAMEWLAGESLSSRLSRGAISIDDTVALGRRVAAALGAAHQAGVVHRDVKPSNVILVEGSIAQAKLIDFGIAKRTVVEGWEQEGELTRTGTIVGTP